MNLFVEGSFLFLSLASWSSVLINMAVKGTLLVALVLLLGFIFRKCTSSIQSLLWTFLFCFLLLIPVVQTDHANVYSLFKGMIFSEISHDDSLILLSEERSFTEESFEGKSSAAASNPADFSSLTSGSKAGAINYHGWNQPYWFLLMVTVWMV